jgi:hypothetical protein
MKDTLIVTESRGGYGYRIGWYLADEGDIGLVLGPFKGILKRDPKTVTEEELDTTLAIQAINGLTQPDRNVHDTEWEWESRSQAEAALRVAKAAIKAGVDRPMPDWAVKATEAGWTPPKGWRP